MGLVANVVEAAGVATACLSMIPPLTRNTGAPRVVGVAHPMGLPIGRPGDAERPAGGPAGGPGSRRGDGGTRASYVELPFVWPERRSTAMREPDPPPPIARLLTKKPWLLPRLAGGHIPTHLEEARS